MHTKRNPEGMHSAKRLIQNHSPFHSRKKELRAPALLLSVQNQDRKRKPHGTPHRTWADKPKSEQDPENRHPLGIVQGQDTDAKES